MKKPNFIIKVPRKLLIEKWERERKEGVYKLGEINGVAIYYDKYQKDGKFIAGRKGKKLISPGIVCIPFKKQENPKITKRNQSKQKRKK